MVRVLNVPTTLFANSFRNPLGNGLTSSVHDGDGYYVAFGFDEPNPDIGGSFHLGADWNGEGGGNSDLGDPVYAIGNATVVAVVSDQGSATTGFGNYVVLRHELPELSCCRFRGHEDKIVTKELESGYDETEVQP